MKLHVGQHLEILVITSRLESPAPPFWMTSAHTASFLGGSGFTLAAAFICGHPTFLALLPSSATQALLSQIHVTPSPGLTAGQLSPAPHCPPAAAFWNIGASLHDSVTITFCTSDGAVTFWLPAPSGPTAVVVGLCLLG